VPVNRHVCIMLRQYLSQLIDFILMLLRLGTNADPRLQDIVTSHLC